LERFATAFKDKFAAIFYFESPPPKVDWEIRTEARSMTAFASMGSAVVVPPPDPDAERIAELEAEVAALEVEVAGLVKTNNEALLLIDSLQAKLDQIHTLSG
jgi:hypothetical protein